MTIETIPLRLETGDHLDQREFHRRYEAMPRLKKAELLDGVVFVPSPASLEHSAAQAAVTTWLGTYAASVTGVAVLTEATVILSERDEVQPDALLRVTGPLAATGRSAGGYVEGPPELVMEVALSSASYQMHLKRAVYERAGIAEYVVWRIADRQIDWWALLGTPGRYEPVVPDADGLLRSRVFPGLTLDVPAALRDDIAAVLATQRQQLGPP